MTNMQRLVVVLAFIFAVLVGVLAATSLFGGKGSSTASTSSPSTSAGASSTAAGAPSGEAPSAAPSASASPSAAPTPTPTATPSKVPLASIAFVQLTLDATTDSAGTTRSIAFAAGAGTVTVKLKTESGGNSTVCLSANGKTPTCNTGAGLTLTGRSTAKSTNYSVTLRGAAAATPTVTATITFPAAKPKVTIRNARFDGTSYPATNGLQVVATPRSKGTYHMAASWGGHPFLYEVDLIEQGGPGLKQVVATTGATGTTQNFAVAPPNPWMIVLKNSETGFGATPLTATFTWP
jgi:hypothetical protein